jgi:Uma2 family endonuclease
MDTAERVGRLWTADEFLATDQHEFGPAWRYELVDGRIVAHAAPSPEHAAILAGLTGALVSRLRGRPDGCRPESGSGAAPRTRQRNTARIPDATIRCGELPRVVWEVVSPSELRAWRERDRKRSDLQAVEGVEEIVELYQGEMAAHLYRKQADGSWSFSAVGGTEAVLELRSVSIQVPLAEIYEFAVLASEPASGASDE